MFGHRDSLPGAIEMRARHQRAGFLWKLPMSKASSEKWQRRLFVAKDGFLLYYGASASPEMPHFDTKPKGVIPLGGCKVDVVERGPKSFKFGLRITHPDFYAGRMLVLAAESEDEQKAWLATLGDCSRVTMENAKLGDAMIEKLRASGTAAEREKADAMERLQQQALALKAEQEEKLKLVVEGETLKTVAAEAEERARKKEEEVSAMMAEVERRRAEVNAQASELNSMIEERAAALASANAEYNKLKAEGGGGDRAAELEEEKLRLEREKLALERSVRDLTQNTMLLQSNLESAEAQRLRMEQQMANLSTEEGDLSKERQLRKRLERRLQIAEDSLKRLDSALRRSGVKLDVDVFADVKTLMSFFEERVDDVRRDAQRIEIMKKALKARRRYLVASARADGSASMEGMDEEAEDDDVWGDDVDAGARVTTSAGAGAGGATKAAATAFPSSAAPTPAPAPIPAPAPAPAPATGGAGREDDWNDDDSEGPGASDDESGGVSGTAGTAGVVAGAHHDSQGPLPHGWTVQLDDEGDQWYYNEITQETSWLRPNPDGSVPPPAS